MDVTGTTGQDVPEKVPRSCHPSMGEKERRTAFSLNFSWAKPGDHDALSTGSLDFSPHRIGGGGRGIVCFLMYFSLEPYEMLREDGQRKWEEWAARDSSLPHLAASCDSHIARSMGTPVWVQVCRDEWGPGA